MITVSTTLGNIFHDNEWNKKFNKASQSNNFETLILSRTDLSKNRLRAKTNKGTDVGIVLKSDSKIQNGDVLLFDQERFIFIQQNPEKVISVTKKANSEANFDETLVLIGHILGNRQIGRAHV